MIFSFVKKVGERSIAGYKTYLAVAARLPGFLFMRRIFVFLIQAHRKLRNPTASMAFDHFMISPVYAALRPVKLGSLVVTAVDTDSL
jgi:hypothetical protein